MAKITPTFYGKVEDGQFIPEHPDRYKAYLEHISGPVMLVLKRPRKPRSLNENNYYWGVVIQLMSDETGATPEEMHEAMKWQFLRKQVGKIFTVKSTALLDTIAFEEYVENVRRFAQVELSIQVPLPNEVDNEIELARETQPK